MVLEMERQQLGAPAAGVWKHAIPPNLSCACDLTLFVVLAALLLCACIFLCYGTATVALATFFVTTRLLCLLHLSLLRHCYVLFASSFVTALLLCSCTSSSSEPVKGLCTFLEA